MPKTYTLYSNKPLIIQITSKIRFFKANNPLIIQITSKIRVQKNK